jgi:hypothetical protein
MGSLALLGCAQLAGIEERELECRTDADCEERGFEGAACVSNVCEPKGDWSCIGQPARVADPAKRPVVLELFDGSVPVTFGSSQGKTDLELAEAKRYPGVLAEACNPLDATCENPVDAGAKSDAQGRVTLEVPGTFAGFIRLSHEDALDTSLYLGPLLAEDDPSQYFGTVVSKTLLVGLAAAMNVPLSLEPKNGKGHVIFSVFDCADRLMEGVDFAIEGKQTEATPWILLDQTPVVGATRSERGGTGGFVNVPTGNLVIRFRAPGGADIGRANVFIRESALTSIMLRARAQAR